MLAAQALLRDGQKHLFRQKLVNLNHRFLEVECQFFAGRQFPLPVTVVFLGSDGCQIGEIATQFLDVWFTASIADHPIATDDFTFEKHGLRVLATGLKRGGGSEDGCPVNSRKPLIPGKRIVAGSPGNFIKKESHSFSAPSSRINPAENKRKEK